MMQLVTSGRRISLVAMGSSDLFADNGWHALRLEDPTFTLEWLIRGREHQLYALKRWRNSVHAVTSLNPFGRIRTCGLGSRWRMQECGLSIKPFDDLINLLDGEPLLGLKLVPALTNPDVYAGSRVDLQTGIDPVLVQTREHVGQCLGAA
jgi:hypothetical protein